MSKRERCAVDGKYRYPTFEVAVHAALVANRRRGTPLRVYECATCGGGYHLTKNPGGTWVATVPPPFTPSDMARLVANRKESA